MTPKPLVSRGLVYIRIVCANSPYSAFKIPSSVKYSDGSNAPLTIFSTVTLDELKIIIAEKLHRFPGLIQLRYRLDTDKPKAGATSIRTEEELELFKERMRVLIVPRKLSSGKTSSRALKQFTVVFEDAAEEGAANEAQTKKTTGKKVRLNGFLFRRSLH